MNKPHRPCLALFLVLLAGICVGQRVVLCPFGWVGFVGALLLSVFFFKQTWILYVVLFFWGIAGIQMRCLYPLDSAVFLNKQKRTTIHDVVGIIDGDIEKQAWAQGEKTTFVLSLEHYIIQGKSVVVSGKIKVDLYASPQITLHYGQRVKVRGKIHPVFDGNKQGFSYRRYLRDQGIFWMLSVGKSGGIRVLDDFKGNYFVYVALVLRKAIVNIFHQYLSPREAGFVSAIVIGDKSNFPKDLNDIFKNTGTAHILAISGMNMTIVAGGLFFMLRLLMFPRRMLMIATMVGLLIYAFISGWSPSVVRACLMSCVLLGSFVLEENQQPLNSLGAAGIMLLLLDPNYAFDIGFQLSFAAVAGILWWSEAACRFLSCMPSWLGGTIAVSFSAWVATAPIIFYHFKNITPIAIVANIPIVPLADTLMLLGLGLAATGAWCPPLAWAFAGCLKAALSALIIIASWFNAIPWGHWFIR